jgi:hypothetical protein
MQLALTPFSQSVRVLFAAKHAEAMDLYVRPGKMAPVFSTDSTVAAISITLSSSTGFDNPSLCDVALMVQ